MSGPTLEDDVPAIQVPSIAAAVKAWPEGNAQQAIRDISSRLIRDHQNRCWILTDWDLEQVKPLAEAVRSKV